MKTVKILLFALLLSIGCTASVAAETGFTWKITDITLAQLLQEQFTVVGAQFDSTTTDLGKYREAIYLQKETELYRCLTVVRGRGRLSHECCVAAPSAD
jgi:hypothetical protein